QGDGLRLARRDVELPDAEVVLEDDGLAVAADAGEADVAAVEMSDLLRVSAFFGDAPDVCKALALAVADEVDEAVLAPAWPRGDPVKGGQVLEGLGREVHDGHVALVGTPVIFPPVRLGLAIDRELGPVGREAAGDAHIGPGVSWATAVDGNDVELAHEVLA